MNIKLLPLWNNKRQKSRPRKKTMTKLDPHHCRCFAISKMNFREFEIRMKNLGFSEPFFEDDHKQILGFTKPVYPCYQIHVKLMISGSIEAEIEPTQDLPIAHLNPIHSFSAHPELKVLFTTLQIPYKCKRQIPDTCINRQVIPPQNPTPMNTFLTLGGVGAVLDIFLNDGKITSVAFDILSKQVGKTVKRKIKRRQTLNRIYGNHASFYT